MRYREAEIKAKKNGVSDFKNTKYCITTVLGKKGPSRKGYFWSQKNVNFLMWMVSERCLKGVWMVYERCLEGNWELSGWGLEGVQKVLARCFGFV